MPILIKPSRNRVIQLAFAGLRADERKAKKAIDAEAKTPKEPAKKAAAKKGRGK